MDGEVDPESMTLEEKRKESRRQKREREEREAAIKREEKVRLGNEGGGIGDNYKSYCRKCKVEQRGECEKWSSRWRRLSALDVAGTQ